MALRRVLLLSLCSAASSLAQAPESRPWAVQAAHYAKWPGLAATGTMFALGVIASRDAARLGDQYRAIRDERVGRVAPCGEGLPCPGPNLAPEQAAQIEWEAAQGRARNWILAGEAALIGTGVMFLIDLIHRDDGPPNVPFTPFTVYAAPGRVGLSLRRP